MLRWRLIALVLVAVSCLSGASLPVRAQEETPAAECVETTPEQNLAVVNLYWQEAVWGKQGKIATVMDPEEVHHWGIGGDTVGVEEFLERWGLFNSAFPGLVFTVEQAVAQNDLVATLWTATGTQTGEWQGIAPTGRDVTWQGINIFRIKCGLIAESWGEADHIGLLQQLGATDVPAPMASPAAAPVAAAAMGTPCPDDTPEGNTAIARRWTEEVVSKQDLAVLDEILAPEIVHHGATFAATHGVEAVKAALQRINSTLPETLTVELTVANGDLVAVLYQGTGTHEGDYYGMPATSKPVEITGINLYRIHCGRIVESWSKVNSLAILRQIEG